MSDRVRVTFTLAEFQASGLWNRSDGTANDYVHFGDATYALFGQAAANTLRLMRR